MTTDLMTTNVATTIMSETQTFFISPENVTDDSYFILTTDEEFNNSTDDTFVENIATTSGIFETTTMGDGRNFRFEDYTQRAIIGTLVCFVSLFGFVGNFMVMLAVSLSKKLQTRTNAFVVNLASADMVTCLAAPFSSVALFSTTGWPLPEAVCEVASAIGFASLACSVMNLAAISINRYVLITKSRETYHSIYTPKKIAAMLMFTWLYPALICCIPLFGGIGKWGYSEKYKTCTQDTSAETSDLFSLLGSALIYPIPLIILFVCYFKIYRHITGHMKKMMGKGIEMAEASNSSSASSTQLHRKPAGSFSKRQVQITKNLFVVVCAFVACLAPFAIALTIPPSDPVIPWTGAIIIFNSAVNPVIYGVKHPHFNEVFRHMLRCRYHMIPEPSSCLRKMRST